MEHCRTGSAVTSKSIHCKQRSLTNVVKVQHCQFAWCSPLQGTHFSLELPHLHFQLRKQSKTYTRHKKKIVNRLHMACGRGAPKATYLLVPGLQLLHCSCHIRIHSSSSLEKLAAISTSTSATTSATTSNDAVGCPCCTRCTSHGLVVKVSSLADHQKYTKHDRL